MVECTLGVLVEGLGMRPILRSVGDRLVGEPIGIASGFGVEFKVREPVGEPLFAEEPEGAPGGAEVGFGRFTVAEELGYVFDAEAEILSEKFERAPLCAG